MKDVGLRWNSTRIRSDLQVGSIDLGEYGAEMKPVPLRISDEPVMTDLPDLFSWSYHLIKDV
jgi:hypothetical protein